ncbi:MAG: hypothetical protein EB168_11235 [Euryarchaeota archaeon]|nr:hypothetical protein [Euryarchaeota archaeon]
MATTMEYTDRIIRMNKSNPQYSQKRMKLMVKYLKRYIKTYDKQFGYENYTDKTLILDILYGLGVAIDPIEHRHAGGFDKWKEKLIKFLGDELPPSVLESTRAISIPPHEPQA